MVINKYSTKFVYKVSGEESEVLVSGEISPTRELNVNGTLLEGRGIVDGKPFTDINFNGYLQSKCITDDIIDFLKSKLKEEHGRKVHFIE